MTAVLCFFLFIASGAEAMAGREGKVVDCVLVLSLGGWLLGRWGGGTEKETLLLRYFSPHLLSCAR